MAKSTKLVGLDWLYRKMDEHDYSSLQAVAEACDLNRGNLYRYFAFETRPGRRWRVGGVVTPSDRKSGVSMRGVDFPRNRSWAGSGAN